MFKRSVAVALAALVLMGSSAQATEDPLDEDVSCLVATMALSSSTDPAMRENGMRAAMYWFGRVDGRGVGTQLEERIRIVASSMDRETLGRELIRCGAIMVERGSVLQQIGRRMQEQNL